MEWPRLKPALILSGLAALVLFALRGAFAVAGDRLPGVDAGIHYAWEVYTRSALDTGRLPHWNPYLSAGMPHLATLQVAVLYPPAMLLRWLPTALFLPSMFAFHLWLGGAGALFLSRVIGLGWLPAASVAAAATFGGSVAPALYHGHVLVVSCAAWFPWALALSILSVRRPTMWPHPALPFVLALQSLAGVQASLYTAGAVSLYFLFSAVWPHEPSTQRVRPLAQLALLGLLTLGLSAFQMVPFAQVVAEAARTAGLPYELATEHSWSFGDLSTTFFPFAGQAESPPYRGLPDRAYVGWLLACLIPVAFLDQIRRRAAIFFAILTLASVAMALGDHLPFYRLHYMLVPGLRIPGRLLFIATLGLAVLGGLGLERFVALAAERRWRLLTAAMTAMAFALGAAALIAFERVSSGTAAPVHAWPWLPPLALASLLAIVLMSARVGSSPALALGLLIVASDVTMYSAGAVHTVPLPPPELLRSWLGPPVPGRAVSICPNRVGPAELMRAGLPTPPGLGGLSLRDYVEWEVLLDAAERPSDGGLGNTTLRRDLVNLSNVTAIVACEPFSAPALTPMSSVDSVYVYRNDAAWPRAVWTCAVDELPRWQVAARLRRGRFDQVGHLTSGPVVDIRWARGVSDEQRVALEAQHRLLEGFQREGTTWRYVLDDDSSDNILAILSDPAVEDTNGVERHTSVVRPDSIEVVGERDARLETLVGARPCIERGDVTVEIQDRPDGLLSADVTAPVSGFVFLSEPYYPERQAFVDGERVNARRANLAFTVVPVPAGRHRLELRYVPTSFYLGLGISGLTLIAWAGALVQGRTRRVPAAEHA